MVRRRRSVLRFVFVGYLALATAPKSRPDRHSLGACWVARDEISHLPLRHDEVVTRVERHERSPTLLPCDACAWYGPARSGTWSARLG